MQLRSITYLVILIVICQHSFSSSLKKSKVKSNLSARQSEASNPNTNEPSNVPGTNTVEPALNNIGSSTDKTVHPDDQSGTVKSSFSAYCFLNSNGTVYDLSGMHNENLDYRITNRAGGVVDFNFCRDAVNNCKDKTGLASYTFGVGNNAECIEVAGPSTFSSRFEILYEDNSNKTTVRMIMPAGDICKTDKTQRYYTTFDIECDETAQNVQILSNDFNINNCNNTITVKTKHSCPLFNYFSIYRMIIENKYVFGFLCIFAGLFMCFLGRKFIVATYVIAGAAVVTVLIIWLILSNVDVEFRSWYFWLVVLASLAIGIVVGIVLAKNQWIGRGVLGGLLGFVGGLFAYNLLLSRIESNPKAVFWTTLVVCIAAGIAFGILAGDIIVIIATAVVGAYGFVRGISFMAGGFPDEREVYELGQRGEWDQMRELLTGWVYLYLTVFVIFAIAGMFVQFKYFNKEEDKDKNKKEKTEGEEPLNQQ